MTGKTNVGGAKLFAAIGVTYPEGSVCTCSKGSRTLRAQSSGGQWVFAIPETGTWTLTATSDTSSTSQSVSITAQGQLEHVELAYALDLYNSSVTSGWTNRKSEGDAGTGSIASGKMVLEGSMSYGGSASYYTAFFYYNTKLQCSADKTLNIQVTKRTARAKLVIVNAPEDATAEAYPSVEVVGSAEISATGVTKLPLAEGSYYLGVLFDGEAYIEATRVWIE